MPGTSHFLSSRDRLVYVGLVSIRFAFVFCFGMVHPDEFFQSQEVMATAVFDLTNTFIPWEYNTNQPNRSILFPALVAGFPYICMQKLMSYWNLEFTAAFLGKFFLYAPRLLLFFASFSLDWSLVKICRITKLHPTGPLLTFASSWPTLIFMSRPFSNTVETIAFGFSATALLCLKKHSTCFGLRIRSVILGSLLAFGSFTRFTFIVFFLPIGLFLVWENDQLFCAESLKRKDDQVVGIVSRMLNFFKTLVEGFIGFILIAIPCIVMDTIFFHPNLLRQWHQQPIIQILSSPWVIAPWNNLVYNSQTSNLAEHGLHPRYNHIAINMQLLFGPLPLLGVISCYYWAKKDTNTAPSARYVYLWSACVLVPLLMLSLAPHQEARFLLPILFPLSIFTGNNLFGAQTSMLRITWLVFNLALTIFFGCFHQAGIFPLLFSLDTTGSEVFKAASLVFYKTYMPPRFTIPVQRGQRPTIDIIDLGGSSLDILQSALFNITAPELLPVRAEVHDGYFGTGTYIAAPGSVQLPQEVKRNGRQGALRIKALSKFWPHISTEDFPDLSSENLRDEAALVLYQVWKHE